jgi:Ca2+-binding EF-hand superfamily protein
MASLLPVNKREKDMQLYREAFNLFDKDCSGAIDVEELRDILKSLNEV